MLMLSKYVVPKIEMYSQGPAIEFHANIKNEDKYVVTVGYKSYANYFYGNTKKLTPSDSLFHVKARVYIEMIEKNSVDRLTTEQLKIYDQKIYNWLVNGEIDKTVYFATRIDRENQLNNHVNIKKLYNKGGFVFYSRIPKKE